MGALAALARSAFVRSAAGTGLALAGASFLGGGDGVDPITGLIHVGGHRRRRRRRRALTASDRADIGFISESTPRNSLISWWWIAQIWSVSLP